MGSLSKLMKSADNLCASSTVEQQRLPLPVYSPHCSRVLQMEDECVFTIQLSQPLQWSCTTAATVVPPRGRSWSLTTSTFTVSKPEPSQFTSDPKPRHYRLDHSRSAPALGCRSFGNRCCSNDIVPNDKNKLVTDNNTLRHGKGSLYIPPSTKTDVGTNNKLLSKHLSIGSGYLYIPPLSTGDTNVNLNLNWPKASYIEETGHWNNDFVQMTDDSRVTKTNNEGSSTDIVSAKAAVDVDATKSNSSDSTKSEEHMAVEKRLRHDRRCEKEFRRRLRERTRERALRKRGDETARHAKRCRRRGYTGDRLLEIGGQPVLGSDLSAAADWLREAPSIVELKLRRGAGSQSSSDQGCLDVVLTSVGGETALLGPLTEEEENDDGDAGVMGSNISRQNHKGLSRRSHSSGNLYSVKKMPVTNSSGLGLCRSSKYRLSGSLPNNLCSIDKKGSTPVDVSVVDINNQRNLQSSWEAPPPPVWVTDESSSSSDGVVLMPTDATHDLGYGSERSPDEDDQSGKHQRTSVGSDVGRSHRKALDSKPYSTMLPPPDIRTWKLSPRLSQTKETSKVQRRDINFDISEKHITSQEILHSSRQDYPFITKDNTFTVELLKGSRGLGLSVSGGIDSCEPYPGLLRVKRLFPHQPAWQSGLVAPGDIILRANGVPLTGLTNYEALEVLRTTPAHTVLVLCRPPAGILSPLLPPPSEFATPQKPVSLNCPTSNYSSSHLTPVPSSLTYGEAEVTLTKVSGSLGFTLRKEDESILGHYVRALVREPAISDGRIRPGDKILSVNGVDLSPLSHEEAVQFLRQCPDTVTLRIYRDSFQTPVTALSPTEPTKRFKPKPILRKEAMDMLCDLAVRKQSPSSSPGITSPGRSHLGSPGCSPRRRRLTKTSSPESTLTSQPLPPPPPEFEQSTSSDNEELYHSDDSPNFDRPKRPNFLDLAGGGSSIRKQKYLFLPPEDDAMDSSLPSDTDASRGCSVTNGDAPTNETFSHHNPAYQSANMTSNKENSTVLKVAAPMTSSDQDIPAKLFGPADGSQGLLKWKGVMFSPDGDEGNRSPSPSPPSTTETDATTEQGEVIFTVELNKGWNSRLGFSLQEYGEGTLISAVYPDSVAARDGRLQAGDQLLKVNDEDVSHENTSYVIDLLRKIRGPIAVTVVRRHIS